MGARGRYARPLTIVRTKLTEADFVSAGWLAIRKRSRTSVLALMIFPILSVFLICVAGIVISTGQSWKDQQYLLFAGAFLAVFPILWYPYLFKRSFRKVPLLAEERTFEFDETGMHLSGSVYSSRTEWGLFTKFAENKNVFIIFQQGNVIYFPLPKRELNAAAIDAIRQILSAHLKTV